MASEYGQNVRGKKPNGHYVKDAGRARRRQTRADDEHAVEGVESPAVALDGLPYRLHVPVKAREPVGQNVELVAGCCRGCHHRHGGDSLGATAERRDVLSDDRNAEMLDAAPVLPRNASESFLGCPRREHRRAATAA
jgi:hypothetical protein